jgi:hypothetical protein
MKTLATIQEELHLATSQISDPAIKALGEAVKELCIHIQSIDRLSHLAAEDARRAVRMGRT